MISRSPRIAGSIRASLLLAALTCGVTASGVQVSYQYYRVTPIKLRNDATANSVALAEFQFLLSGSVVSTTGATATNVNGTTQATETAVNLIDGSTANKWLDFNKSSFVVAFTAATPIDGYRFTTGNDGAERDPLRWTLEGSADGTTWMLIDHQIADFATPTARTTSTPNILLPATVEPILKDWTGSQSASWDTTSANWTTGSASLWDNSRYDTARFSAGAPTTITVAEPVTARTLDFTGSGYLVKGGTLTLTGITRITGAGSAEISSSIAGTSGLTKNGASTLTLSGTNPYAGPTLVRGGVLAFTGTGTKSGAGALTVGDKPSKGALLIADTSTVVFNGTAIAGNNAAGPGVIRQTGGTATYGADSTYLTLGTVANSYGSYELAGGSLTTIANSGVRVGQSGYGVLTQTGGALSSGRWFALGGAGGHGVATFSSGTASVSAAYRTILGDQAAGDGVLNIGTEAGGDAVFSALRTANGGNDGSIVVSGNPTSTGTLNLNSGILSLSGRLYQAGGAGQVNLNGGTVRAAATGVELMNSSISNVKMFRGGLTIDTDGKDATLNTFIAGAADSGVYITGGSIPVTAGSSGYIGAPYVTVTSSGSGTGAGAIATIAGGAVSGVTMTSPGESYAAGDTLTFTFTGGGADTPAVPFSHKLTAAEVASNGTGGFTKAGAGKLISTTGTSYPGPTTVAAGTLVANAFMDMTTVTVAAGATLAGNLTVSSPLIVSGTLSPGADLGQIGLITGSDTLRFSAGSTYAVQIGDWTGDSGVGYDSTSFGSVVINATTGSKLTISVDGTGLVNFTEAAKTFTIASASNSLGGLTTTNWQVATSNFPGLGTWSLAASGKDLVLAYTPAAATGYTTWVSGFPALTDKSKTGDPDGDGIQNVMEYVLNGNPGAASRAILPTGAISGSNYVFTFVRRAESKTDTTQAFEYGSTLSAWTAIPIPSATSANVTITPNQPSSGLETVVVSVPVTSAVNGRLFGRLSVTTP
ncbi:MAG: hypothetical protein JWO82_1326 [Akkermansiaceae bacterium]|nr:hypothetical protein [Akkermansiaceae bacterium]